MTRYESTTVFPTNLTPMNLEQINGFANKGHSIRVYSEEETKQIVQAVISDCLHDETGKAVKAWIEFSKTT